jgi:hypothetical protein
LSGLVASRSAIAAIAAVAISATTTVATAAASSSAISTAAAAAAATAAVPAASATVSASTATALGALAGLIDHQRPSAAILAIQAIDRRSHVGFVRHLHETEAARPAGVAVHDHFRSGHVAVLLEQLL